MSRAGNRTENRTSIIAAARSPILDEVAYRTCRCAIIGMHDSVEALVRRHKGNHTPDGVITPDRIIRSAVRNELMTTIGNARALGAIDEWGAETMAAVGRRTVDLMLGDE